MQVRYNATTTSTLTPIIIDVSEAPAAPQITVSPQAPGAESFALTAKKTGDEAYQANFWLEQPGHYAVLVESSGDRHTQPLHITAHRFLPFGVEFGVFLITLALAAGGLYLWQKKKRRF